MVEIRSQLFYTAIKIAESLEMPLETGILAFRKGRGCTCVRAGRQLPRTHNGHVSHSFIHSVTHSFLQGFSVSPLGVGAMNHMTVSSEPSQPLAPVGNWAGGWMERWMDRVSIVNHLRDQGAYRVSGRVHGTTSPLLTLGGSWILRYFISHWNSSRHPSKLPLPRL